MKRMTVVFSAVQIAAAAVASVRTLSRDRSRFTNAEKSRVLYRPCAKEGVPSEDKGAGDRE